MEPDLQYLCLRVVEAEFASLKRRALLGQGTLVSGVPRVDVAGLQTKRFCGKRAPRPSTSLNWPLRRATECCSGHKFLS